MAKHKFASISDNLWVEDRAKSSKYFDPQGKEIEGNLCFPFFPKIGENFEWPNFWGWQNTNFLRYPVGRKFRRNRLFRTVKEIEANCVLPFLAKIRKFKMAAIFGEGKIFGKLQTNCFIP